MHFLNSTFLKYSTGNYSYRQVDSRVIQIQRINGEMEFYENSTFYEPYRTMSDMALDDILYVQVKHKHTINGKITDLWDFKTQVSITYYAKYSNWIPVITFENTRKIHYRILALCIRRLQFTIYCICADVNA